MTDLSIIVPVYNVEKYVQPCLESIFKQGLDESRFEVIIVNDGTKDRSMEMIADIISQHKNITVIEQENQGLSVARNNGIEAAKGEYIQFLDSDDLLIHHSMGFMLDKAIETKADLIVGDFIKLYDEQITEFNHQSFKQTEGASQEKSGRELFLQDLNPYYCQVWRTLYRREFLNKHQLKFIPSICYEDIPFTHQCYLTAERCVRANWQYIIYRKGQASITSTFTKKKALDYGFAVNKLWSLSKEPGLDDAVRLKIRDDAFVSFSLLFYVLTSTKSISSLEKVSIFIKMKKITPHISFKHGLKQRIVTFLYRRAPLTYITLRIFYARYLQNICWAIGDFVRNKKN